MRRRYVLALTMLVAGCSDTAPVPQSTSIQKAISRVPETPSEADIPKLIELMNDSDPPTRHQAALALARIDGPAVPAVVECLQDERSLVREGAAKALGRMKSKPKEAAIPLSERLADPNQYVRREAGDSLIRIGGLASDQVMAAIEALMSDAPGSRRWAANKLGAEAAKAKVAVPALTRLLDDPDEEVREAVATALKKIEQVEGS